MTAAALYSLQKKAYEALVHAPVQLSFEEWRCARSNLFPQFKYWNIALNIELIILQFVRSIRKGDFTLYVDSLRRLVPWFFALDHINYARWLSVHIRDLANLGKMHPKLLEHFNAGLFVARTSNRPFSGMALDQAHEQMNALMKGDGGNFIAIVYYYMHNFI